MIWYKSSIQERSSPLGAKMGRGSPVCQQIREKIIEMFKKKNPQRKIGRDLDISPSTVHNIIKRFKESGGISVRKGQGRKPKLNNRDLRSLRRHCIKNPHSSISDITTWAQDYIGKPLSSTTIRSCIHKCQLKLYCAKRKPYVNSVQKRRRLLWARRHLGWTITQWKRVLWSDESVFQVFFGRNGCRVLRTKEEKDHPDCYQQYFPCIFQQDNAKPHSAHITKSWLRRKRVRVLDWPACSPDLSPIENVWRILKRKMRQRRPRTVAHLKTCLQEEWDKITPETLYRLVSSVPKRRLSVVKGMATLQSGKCFTVPTLQVWMTGKDVYLQMTWSWPDKTWNILCSYCLQWNTSQSKFRNHYFLFYLRFPYCPNFFWFGVVFTTLFQNSSTQILECSAFYGGLFPEPGSSLQCWLDQRLFL